MFSIAHCVDFIRAGELLAFPTETVYGLGADACNDAAVAKIFAAKGRPADHPLIVHVADAAAASHFVAELPSFAQSLMTAFWPGPLTLILPRKPAVAAAAAGGQNSIGLRCPSHPLARELLSACAAQGVLGVAAPSANKFGKVSPTTAAHVRSEFADLIPVLDGGACEVGIESSIIDCSRGAPALLRPGVLTREEINAVLLAARQPLLVDDTTVLQPAPRASGDLESHYAPAAPLRIMDAKALQTALDLLGSQAQHIAVYACSPLQLSSTGVLLRRMPLDARACAQQLFAVLREFDAQGVKLIWVEQVPTSSQWDGVRDRLSRAAAPQPRSAR